ncbi:MAG: AraC family transcriptional regulator ligand-binding domain-containing protein [Cyanobacteria bacterium P01_H01_bin.105]
MVTSVEPTRIVNNKSQTNTAAVASVFNYALHRGIGEQQLSAETGLVRTDLVNPETRLPGELLPILWNILGNAYSGQAVGLQMASVAPLPLPGFGPIPQAMKYAENLRSALKIFIHYRFVLSDQLWLNLVESDGEAFLQMYHPLDVLDAGRAAESVIALIRRSVQQAIDIEDPLVRVEFAHRPHSMHRIYETFFGVPVCFQQTCNALVFRRKALDIPTKQRDVHLFRYVQGNLDLLRDRWGLSDNTSPLTAIHRTIAQKAEFYEYSAEGIARHMNMSLRSLQRLVSDHGLTMRQLLENTRREKARQLLGHPALNIEAIAAQLGYSDVRAFRRAFKRWTGETPAQFRAGFMSRT